VNKVDRFCFLYVIFSFPLVLTLLIWGAFDDPSHFNSSGVKPFLWGSLFWIFLTWIIVSLYLMIKNIVSKSFRDVFLKKLARVKERDEREEQISGEAAKFTFFSSLAVLFFFLFLSIFTMGIGKKLEGVKPGEKPGFISFGVNINPLEMKKKQPLEEKQKNSFMVSYQELPLSKMGLILFLIMWQVGSYHLIVRRESKV